MLNKVMEMKIQNKNKQRRRKFNQQRSAKASLSPKPKFFNRKNQHKVTNSTKAKPQKAKVFKKKNKTTKKKRFVNIYQIYSGIPNKKKLTRKYEQITQKGSFLSKKNNRRSLSPNTLNLINMSKSQNRSRSKSPIGNKSPRKKSPYIRKKSLVRRVKNKGSNKMKSKSPQRSRQRQQLRDTNNRLRSHSPRYQTNTPIIPPKRLDRKSKSLTRKNNFKTSKQQTRKPVSKSAKKQPKNNKINLQIQDTLAAINDFKNFFTKARNNQP